MKRRRDPTARFVVREPPRGLSESILDFAASLHASLGPRPSVDALRVQAAAPDSLISLVGTPVAKQGRNRIRFDQSTPTLRRNRSPNSVKHVDEIPDLMFWFRFVTVALRSVENALQVHTLGTYRHMVSL